MKEKVLMIGSKDIDTISNLNVYDTYNDLYLSETEREEIKWIFHFIVDNLVDKQITERAESNQEIILSRQLLMTGAIITSYMVLFNSCTLPGHCLFSQDSIMKCQCSNPYFLVEPYCPFEQPEPFCPRMNRIVCENYFLPDC